MGGSWPHVLLYRYQVSWTPRSAWSRLLYSTKTSDLRVMLNESDCILLLLHCSGCRIPVWRLGAAYARIPVHHSIGVVVAARNSQLHVVPLRVNGDTFST